MVGFQNKRGLTCSNIKAAITNTQEVSISLHCVLLGVMKRTQNCMDLLKLEEEEEDRSWENKKLRHTDFVADFSRLTVASLPSLSPTACPKGTPTGVADVSDYLTKPPHFNCTKQAKLPSSTSGDFTHSPCPAAPAARAAESADCCPNNFFFI